MTLLGRTISRGYAYSSTAFSDAASIPAWAADHINLLYSMGIVKGYTAGGKNLIKPLDTITRAEFASLLYQIY